MVGINAEREVEKIRNWTYKGLLSGRTLRSFMSPALAVGVVACRERISGFGVVRSDHWVYLGSIDKSAGTQAYRDCIELTSATNEGAEYRKSGLN